MAEKAPRRETAEATLLREIVDDFNDRLTRETNVVLPGLAFATGLLELRLRALAAAEASPPAAEATLAETRSLTPEEWLTIRRCVADYAGNENWARRTEWIQAARALVPKVEALLSADPPALPAPREDR